MITKEIKLDVINKFKINDKDTGSVEVQIALLTERINRLNGKHFKVNPKDQSSRYGLLKLVGHRRSLLDYLSRYNSDKYAEVISRLQLRK